MDVLSVIKERRSIRNYRKKEIPDDLLTALAESLVWAPSAGNLQSRKFYFVKDIKLRQNLVSAALGQAFIAEAPVAVVCCTDSAIGRHYGMRGIELYTIQDVAASVMCMMITAVSYGLGTCWVGAFREEEVSEALSLPSHLRPVAIVPVGYPERVPHPPSRVALREAAVFI